MTKSGQTGIDQITQQQLEQLPPVKRPLVVCDVDEVILHMVEPFEKLLDEHGFELRRNVAKLVGSVFAVSDGREAEHSEVWKMLGQLFEQQTSRQHIVEGVVASLKRLNSRFDILLLTNLPHIYGDVRRSFLASLDIGYPVVTNTGAKGPVLKWLFDNRMQELVFIDDTVVHLESVKDHTPDTHLIHFMADQTYRAMTKLPETVLLSTGDWKVVEKTVCQGFVDCAPGPER